MPNNDIINMNCKINNIKIVIASGYFNPLHSGHIKYLEEARKLGDYLLVIVNNDRQVYLKNSKKFMDEKERLLIVSSLKFVNNAVIANDVDKSVCNTLINIINSVNKTFYNNNCTLIFAKGGDRTAKNIPEYKICKKLKIKMIFGVGGYKKLNSSSKLLQNAGRL